MKKSLGVIGGSGWSTEAIEKALTSSFGYITSQTQNIDQTLAGLGRMGIATGGRGSKYVAKYGDLIAAGRDGNPRFRETMELADEIANDKNLSKTDQRALISQITGSSEITEKLMTNAEIGKYSLAELNKEYYPKALAGITQGEELKGAGQSTRKWLTDVSTKMNLNSELQKIIQEADEKASKEFGFFGSIWNRSEFQKRRDQLVKSAIDEKSALIPALEETYRKEASLYGVTPIVNIENNFNVSSDYDAERAGDIVTDSININLKNSQEFD